jgi:hypothetical protein
MDKYTKNILRSIVLLILGIIGIATLIGAYKTAKFGDTKDWIQTNADILESSYELTVEKGEKKYVPIIKYEFKVKDKTYTGNRINLDEYMSFDAPNSAIDFAENQIKSQSSSGFMIYYNPYNPNESAIYLSDNIKVNLVLGTVLALLGLIGVFLLSRTIKQIRTKDLSETPKVVNQKSD